jgi:YbbR domain-containing protein
MPGIPDTLPAAHAKTQDLGAVITGAAATVTQNTADYKNGSFRGIKVVLDMTTVGTGSVTVTIQGKDAASGKYYTLLAGAAVVTNSTNVYTVFPGAPATANVSANDQLPQTFRILVTANNANPATYTVGATLLP